MTKLKEIKTKEARTPKVVKVSTIVITVVVALAIIGSFVAGWAMSNNDQARVQTKAQELVKSLDEK